MKLLVCGGRDFNDRTTVWSEMDRLNPDIVIHGGAAGADSLADAWAKEHRRHTWQFIADWDTHGRAAGPIRNQAMLDDGKPDAVLAFPGGRGTADMVRRAKAAGVKCYEVLT